VARPSLTLVPATRRLAGVVVAAVAGAVLTVGLTATPAAALSVESAEPAANSQVDEAPDEIRLEFDDLVGFSEVTISVTGPDGDATDGGTRVLGDTARRELQEDLPNGRYTVSWSVSESNLTDGGSGSLAFRIGPAPPRDLPSPTGSAGAPAPPRPTDRATTPPSASSKPSATPTGISSPTATKGGRARAGDPITAARPTANVPQPDVAGIRSTAAEWLPPPVFWWALVAMAVVGGMTWRRRRNHPPTPSTPPAPATAPEPHLVPAAGRESAPSAHVPS
jgi:methionine-rich copper-binding protein CopC